MKSFFLQLLLVAPQPMVKVDLEGSSEVQGP